MQREIGLTNSYGLVRDLRKQFLELHPNAPLDVESSVNAGDQHLVQLLGFARTLQIAHPIYEAAYHYLVHQFVLQGSRAGLLGTVDRRLQAAVAGQGGLVLIEGVSGIGKTSFAMAHEVRGQELGAAFVVGRCYQHGATPFGVWHETVRRIEKLTAVSSADLAAPLGQGPEAQSREHLMTSLAGWLSACSAGQPLIVLLDDLHWADVDSLEMLNRLASQLERHPILFIATYRSEEAQRGHPLYDYIPLFRRNRVVDKLRLNALTSADTARLITALHGPCHPRLAEYLFSRAEGHPLFAVELLRDLIDQGLLSQDADGFWLPPDQSVPAPAMLRHVILQRVSRLGEAAESLLLHAAVVGDIWELDLVEHLAGLPEDVLLDGLEHVLAADLVRAVSGQEEAYEFSHGLIQEVLYAEQIPRRRKRLHERTGAYLEQQGAVKAARLAHHYYQAENWEKAFRYCLAAGREAAQSFANNRALDFYQKALDALRRSKTAGAERRLVEIYERLGDTCRVLDLQVEAEAAFRGMQDAARNLGDLTAQGRALTNLILVHVAQYRQDAAERTAREALGIAEQLGDARLLAQAHGGLGKLLLVAGQLDASAYHFNQFHHHGAALKDPETQSDLLRQQAYLALWVGRYAEAQGLAQQCLDEGLTSGNLLSIAGGYQILSISQIEAGAYWNAYQSIRTILDQTERAGAYHHQLPRLLNQMGYLFLELGDAEQALAWDERAWAATADARRESRHEMKRYCLLNIATDLLCLDRLAEARELATRCEAIIDAPTYARFRYHNRYLLLMSELHMAESDFRQSIAFAQEARALAEAHGASKNIAKSHWLEGQALLAIKERAGAVEHLEQAVVLADAIRHGSLRWRVRLSLAQALSTAGRSPEECAEAARALIGQIHDSLAGSSLRDSFDGNRRLAQLDELTQLDKLARLEERTSPKGRVRKSPSERPAYPAGLTGREVEILRLVASGATNQQVADALTISPRTVNTHVTNILNKTGCENRTAASAFAVKHNLLSA